MTGTPEGWHKATQQIETMHYTTPFARGSDNFLGGLPGVPLLTQLHRPATLYRLALRRGSEHEILPVGRVKSGLRRVISAKAGEMPAYGNREGDSILSHGVYFFQFSF